MRPILVCLALLVCSAPAAQAATTPRHGPCIIGTSKPKCYVWRGTVPFQANDGDTVDVRLDGDGKRLTRVRITGIQAMELSSYGSSRLGECHGVDAALRLDDLLGMGGRKVRIAAIDPESRSRGRLLRSVAVKIDGNWFDVGQTLIQEGLALWLPYHDEYAYNDDYSRLSRAAQLLALQGLWDSDSCGAGPNDGQPLQVWVSSNPDGADKYALEDEYMTIRNQDPINAIDLSGWWVRDSGLRRYSFAPGTVLAPGGGYVTVHVGEGADTPSDRYWGLGRPLFDNATSNEQALGEGGYLFDPQGDLRAAMIYPCRTRCTDPYQGALKLDVHGSGTEYVDVTNVSAAAVDLFGYRLFNSPYGYAFGPGTVLQPGQSLRVEVKGFPEEDTPERKHWGLADNILNNSGDRVTLRTFDDIVVACEAYGRVSC